MAGKHKKQCVGLTGRMSSGKGEVVRILEKNNYKYISLSDMVREEAARAKKEITRSDMQNIGNRLRELRGPGILGKRVREKIENSDYEKWVIDGIRHPSEIDAFCALPAVLIRAFYGLRQHKNYCPGQDIHLSIRPIVHQFCYL